MELRINRVRINRVQPVKDWTSHLVFGKWVGPLLGLISLIIFGRFTHWVSSLLGLMFVNHVSTRSLPVMLLFSSSHSFTPVETVRAWSNTDTECSSDVYTSVTQLKWKKNGVNWIPAKCLRFYPKQTRPPPLSSTDPPPPSSTWYPLSITGSQKWGLFWNVFFARQSVHSGYTRQESII